MAGEMTEFDIKRGFYANIEGDKLAALMETVFGTVIREGDVCVSSFGVMARIEVKVISKTQLGLLTVNVEDVKSLSDDQILTSKKKLNEFLEKATGFTAKQRMKRAQEKAKKGA